jgi:hypothetical protein
LRSGLFRWRAKESLSEVGCAAEVPSGAKKAAEKVDSSFSEDKESARRGKQAAEKGQIATGYPEKHPPGAEQAAEKLHL